MTYIVGLKRNNYNDAQNYDDKKSFKIIKKRNYYRR